MKPVIFSSWRVALFMVAATLFWLFTLGAFLWLVLS